MLRSNKNTGVSIMEYAVLISILVLAMMAFQTPLRRAINYKWKQSIDSVFSTDGRQYEPGITTVTVNE
jgi:Flp pilus assembly pilin Flp